MRLCEAASAILLFNGANAELSKTADISELKRLLEKRSQKSHTVP
jgi:hypothetical protein